MKPASAVRSNLPLTYLFVPGNRPDCFSKALASDTGMNFPDPFSGPIDF